MYDRWCMTPIVGGSQKRFERFRSGVLNLGFGALDVSEGIDWSADPFGTQMWGFRLHNLQWLYDFYRVSKDSRDDSAAQLANSVIADWIEHNDHPPTAPEIAWNTHVAALRARVLLCSVMVFGGSFRGVLADHARRIGEDALVEPPWNHGTDQLLTLMTIGCALDDDELIGMATTRLRETLPLVIDEQGVSNEQSPTYDYYVWTQLGELARLMSDCGLPEIPLLARRHETPKFLAHATRPDGRWAHLGDTTPKRVFPIEGTSLEYALSMGESASPPDERVATFDSGYAFGRSGWGEERPLSEESWYSIRFGPGRTLHGHVDHTSFTWYARGRPMIVDSGFSGYDAGEFRDYERSEYAHSQVVVEGAGEYKWDASTRLNRYQVGDGWESYSLEDRPYHRVLRRREIFVGHSPPVMVLRDHLRRRARKLTAVSLIHLPADTTEVHDLPTGFAVELPSEKPITLHVFVDGAENFEHFQGWTGTGGWVGEGLLDRQEAQVLASSTPGTKVTLTTVLVPTVGERPDVRVEGNRLTIAIGSELSIVEYRKRTGLLPRPDLRLRRGAS